MSLCLNEKLLQLQMETILFAYKICFPGQKLRMLYMSGSKYWKAYLFNSENKKILLQSSSKETQFDSLRDLRNNLDLIILEKTGNILGK